STATDSHRWAGPACPRTTRRCRRSRRPYGRPRLAVGKPAPSGRTARSAAAWCGGRRPGDGGLKGCLGAGTPGEVATGRVSRATGRAGVRPRGNTGSAFGGARTRGDAAGAGAVGTTARRGDRPPGTDPVRRGPPASASHPAGGVAPGRAPGGSRAPLATGRRVRTQVIPVSGAGEPAPAHGRPVSAWCEPGRTRAPSLIAVIGGHRAGAGH